LFDGGGLGPASRNKNEKALWENWQQKLGKPELWGSHKKACECEEDFLKAEISAATKTIQAVQNGWFPFPPKKRK
jgi:hypothetical protein